MGLHPQIAGAFALDGKVAVITGGGSGMGQEAARIFALAGARVVVADIDQAGLAATLSKVRESGGNVTSHRVDVARREAVEALADAAVAETGRLDIWINSAGIAYLHSLLETKAEEAERTIAVNMMGTYWGCMAAARIMREHGGGSIINVSSAGGSKPVPGLAVYGMTKAAVNSLTWTSAMELGTYGIRVNGIAPGWIDTPMTSQLYRDDSGRIDPVKRDKVFSEMAGHSPLGRVGQVSDIAYALLYLAADASRFVTGQVLRVNGGESM
jgi:3-oxoacyl-[acyl-carrier protein] reductase